MVSEKCLLTYYGKVMVQCGVQVDEGIVTNVSVKNYLLLQEITFTVNVAVDSVDYTHNHIILLASEASQLFLFNINTFHFFKLSLEDSELLLNVGFHHEYINNFSVKRLLTTKVDEVSELEHIDNLLEAAIKLVNSVTSGTCLGSTDNPRKLPTFLISCTDTDCYLVNNYLNKTDVCENKPSLFRIFVENSDVNIKIIQSMCKNKVCQLSSGKDHTLMLTTAGEVYSFGTGNHGELGNGTLDSEQEPVLVLDSLDGVRANSVTSGSWCSAALTLNGDVYVWGWNRNNQFGNSELGIVNIPYLLDYSNFNSDSDQFLLVFAFRDALFLKSSSGKLLVLGDLKYQCSDK